MRSIITKAIALLITLNIATLAQEKGSFTDTRDKKKYKTVKIGEQVWMAENLNFNAPGSKCSGEDGKTAANGFVTLSKAQIQANCTKYGRLYSWETAKKACPTGWHLPFNAEWKKLFIFADSTYTERRNTAGNHLKAKSGWDKVNDEKYGNGTDKFGFSALPGGYFSFRGVGMGDKIFYDVGSQGNWLSATEILDKQKMVYGSRANIRGDDDATQLYGTSDNDLYSVRCIQGDGEEAAKIDAEEKAAKEKAEEEAKAAKDKAEAEVAAKAKAETEAYVKANGGTFTDTRDKKIYKTIKINGQVWLAENLNYAAENTKCYDDKPENCTKYGKLYNWETAKKSCPAGWHLPQNAEWDKLYRSADGTSGTESPYKRSYTAGKFLKSANGWDGTDKFGFSALPGGSFLGGTFKDVGQSGSWLDASGYNNYGKIKPYYRTMRLGGAAESFAADDKDMFSVRCIKD